MTRKPQSQNIWCPMTERQYLQSQSLVYNLKLQTSKLTKKPQRQNIWCSMTERHYLQSQSLVMPTFWLYLFFYMHIFLSFPFWLFKLCSDSQSLMNVTIGLPVFSLLFSHDSQSFHWYSIDITQVSEKEEVLVDLLWAECACMLIVFTSCAPKNFQHEFDQDPTRNFEANPAKTSIDHSIFNFSSAVLVRTYVWGSEKDTRMS